MDGRRRRRGRESPLSFTLTQAERTADYRPPLGPLPLSFRNV